jgi:hypothetical protein
VVRRFSGSPTASAAGWSLLSAATLRRCPASCVLIARPPAGAFGVARQDDSMPPHRRSRARHRWENTLTSAR